MSFLITVIVQDNCHYRDCIAQRVGERERERERERARERERERERERTDASRVSDATKSYPIFAQELLVQIGRHVR